MSPYVEAAPSGMTSGASHRAHRDFLDAYYGWARPIYDVTRKHYLLGRDRTLRELLDEPWSTLVEVGAGTGRNLELLHAARPGARFGALEPSTPMREHLARRCAFARVRDGFAEDLDYGSFFEGSAPDRILFSYSLSMMQDPEGALRNARRSLATGGEVVVVDFGDLHGVPRRVQRLFRRWLASFHVTPVDRALLQRERGRVSEGPLGYYRIVRLPPLRWPSRA
jgi:S-adenosylmethionine-diacylgycerolhomoserine-N-methlytransferase